MKHKQVAFYGSDFGGSVKIDILPYGGEEWDLHVTTKDGKEYGSIFFNDDNGTCKVSIDHKKFRGTFERRDKILTINIPGFTSGKIDLKYLVFKA